MEEPSSVNRKKRQAELPANCMPHKKNNIKSDIQDAIKSLIEFSCVRMTTLEVPPT